MPNKKSAVKALRQSFKRRSLNRKKKGVIKDLTKKIRSLVKEKNTEEAKKNLSLLYKALDKAAKTNTIHKRSASRRKSRIAKLIANNR